MLCKDAKFLPKLSLPGCMLSRISPRKSFEGCWNILALGLFLKFESIFCECVADYHSQGKCQECLQKVCTISSSLIWSIKNLCSETGPQYTGCPPKGISNKHSAKYSSQNDEMVERCQKCIRARGLAFE